MKTICVRGKVMLSGEYSVLYGGTAVLIPVPRYFYISEAEDSICRDNNPVTKSALQISIPELRDFEMGNGEPHLEIDRSEFFYEGPDARKIKLGLGSSAAEAVGIIALRFERAGRPWAENKNAITKYAISAHRRAQKGRGSGADVAACAYQLPIKYRIRDDEFLIEVIKEAADKERIPMALVWTSQAADSREMIARFENWRATGASESIHFFDRLLESGQKLADLWFKESSKVIYEQLDEYMELLEICLSAASIIYKLPIHRESETWAKANGGRAKPTGAGGGDMILLLGDLPIHELKQLTISL